MNATLHLAFVFVLAVGTASVAAPAADTVNAQKAPVRSILDTQMLTGFPTTEVVQGQVTIPPGGVVDWHVHQGDESAYVLSGESVLKVQGQPDRLVHAGDHFFMPRGVPHSIVVAPTGQPGTVMSTWIVDKGKPLLTPVAAPAPAK